MRRSLNNCEPPERSYWERQTLRSSPTASLLARLATHGTPTGYPVARAEAPPLPLHRACVTAPSEPTRRDRFVSPRPFAESPDSSRAPRRCHSRASFPFHRASTRAGPLRVAYPPEVSELLDIDTEVKVAFEAAIAALVGEVELCEPVALPTFKEWDFPRAVPLMVEALLVHQEAGWYPDRSDDYTAETRQALEYAEELPATLLVKSQRTVASLVKRWRAMLDEHNVLALPTTPNAAPSIAEAEAHDEGHRTPVVRNLTRICGPVNCCNLAAVSVPCGFTRGGLPIGMQFIAAHERTALAAGAADPAILNWGLLRPAGVPPPGAVA